MDMKCCRERDGEVGVVVVVQGLEAYVVMAVGSECSDAQQLC